MRNHASGKGSAEMSNAKIQRLFVALALGMALLTTSGCATMKAIPAHRMPPSLLAVPRASKEPINFIRLRQDPPPVYQLGPRDILGIFIEGVLGQADQPPPVHFPDQQGATSGTPPAIGFPIPIREDGTVSLPLVSPIRVSGLTLAQAESEIRRAYIPKILAPGRERIIVTLIRKRTYQILVIREDSGASAMSAEPGGVGLVKRGTARAIDLKAYENDVLHALTETGGLPGLDAKNEIKILRGAFADAKGRAALLEDLEDDNDLSGISPDNPNLVRIPLRRRPNDPPSQVSEEDIVLTNGDIVYIETREREVFYTGGLLQGREQLLPRDYDLDVLGAIALAGASVSSAVGSGGNTGSFSSGGGGGFSSARGLVPPTEIIIVRKVKCDECEYQIPIKVNINRALTNPAERILIQPGDLILLQYTPIEMIANIALNNFNVSYLTGRGLSGS
jgi:protein involved in polysaccharide export with SLBB domain